MISQLSYEHPVFDDDNATYFNHLEEATRGSIIAATIQPFKRRQNGRGAWRAIIAQHCGDDKWEAEIKSSDDFLKTKIWKGNTNHSLERFMEKHSSAYITLQQCAEHVTYQIPHDRTRVKYLIDAINCNEPGVVAALSCLRLDDGVNGMRNNFDATVTFLLPTDPIQIKQKSAGDKRPISEIASVEMKQGTRRTCVELRYHVSSEHFQLKDDHKK